MFRCCRTEAPVRFFNYSPTLLQGCPDWLWNSQPHWENYCPAFFSSFSTPSSFSTQICVCIGRVFCFTQTLATDGLKRWNIQPHQQSILTTKPLLLEERHIFIKLKGIICSFHKGTLQNKGPNHIIKELYHLYKKDFKGNTVIEGKQKDIGQLLIWLFFFCVLLHPFSSCLSLIIYAGLYSPHPHFGSLFWLQTSFSHF